MAETTNKSENQYDVLFTNQKIQLDNAISSSQAMGNVLVQEVQNAVTTKNLVAENATQGANLTNTNVLHLCNSLNAMVVRQADLATDKQWNKEIAECVAENMLMRGLPPAQKQE